jgi:D-alanyl-D-alanine dipeptidase
MMWLFLSLFAALAGAYVCNETMVPVPPDFVWLDDPSIIQEIRYAGHHNFIGSPDCGYLAPKCYLTTQASTALKKAALLAAKYQMRLKVYDCYRPTRTDPYFVEWAKNISDVKMKKEFYPTEAKSHLFRDGYIAEKSGHNRGSTCDLTLVNVPVASQPPYVPGEPLKSCILPQKERFPDNSIDMGTGYDCFNVLAHTNATGISEKAMLNRKLLLQIMQTAGFVNYPQEWWHYTLANEPYPDTYFDFQIK